MTNKYTHLILSGGGLYGLCFLGIFRYLIIEKKLNSLKNIVGNSMGSFFSLGYSLNIDIDKLENIVKELKECNDIKINKKNLGNLFKKNGILNFSIFTNRLKIESKIDDITFKEFSKKFGINLYISATNVNRLENVIFCIDNTPDVSVFDAVAASMSLPYMCEPILIDGEYYIDGCLSNNFPSNIFQNINKNNILGITIKINRDYEIKKYEKNTKFTFLNYNKRLIELLICNNIKTTYLNNVNSDYCDIIIIEDSPINDYLLYNMNKDKLETTISDIDIDNLILDGFIKATEYFKYIKS